MKWKRVIVIAAILFVSVFVAAMILWSPGARWQGRREISLVVRVADSETGEAVSGAMVCLSGDPPGTIERIETICSGEGFGSMKGTFRTFGTETFFGTTEYVSLEGVIVRVTANGYLPLHESLAEYGGISIPLDALPDTVVNIPLRADPSKETTQ